LNYSLSSNLIQREILIFATTLFKAIKLNFFIIINHLKMNGQQQQPTPPGAQQPMGQNMPG